MNFGDAELYNLATDPGEHQEPWQPKNRIDGTTCAGQLQQWQEDTLHATNAAAKYSLEG